MTLHAARPGEGATKRVEYGGRCDVSGCPWHFESRTPALIVELYGNHFEKVHRGVAGALRITPAPPTTVAAESANPDANANLIIPWPPENDQPAGTLLKELTGVTARRLEKRGRNASMVALLLAVAAFVIGIILAGNPEWSTLQLPSGSGTIWLISLGGVLALAAPGSIPLIRGEPANRYRRARSAAMVLAAGLEILVTCFVTVAVLGVSSLQLSNQVSQSFLDGWLFEELLVIGWAVALVNAAIVLRHQNRTGV